MEEYMKDKFTQEDADLTDTIVDHFRERSHAELHIWITRTIFLMAQTVTDEDLLIVDIILFLKNRNTKIPAELIEKIKEASKV